MKIPIIMAALAVTTAIPLSFASEAGLSFNLAGGADAASLLEGGFVAERPIGRLPSRNDPNSPRPTPTPSPSDPDPSNPGPSDPTPPRPEPTGSPYPSYMPVASLAPVKHVFHVLCEESIAAGREVLSDGKALPRGGYSAGGTEMVYEARADNGSTCDYNFSPWAPRPGAGKQSWPTGSQFIWRSSEPGTRVRFTTDNPWAALRLKAGRQNGKRIHMEVVDLDLNFTGAMQNSGALWFESYPDAALGGLSSLVVRNSRITGGKNALFVPSGASMVYVENSEIGHNLGRHLDQHHPVYINGTLTAHFKDTLVYGDNASTSTGGHLLKVKSALRVFENVALDNGGGAKGVTNRPLVDISSFGWTWSDGMSLVRRKPSSSPRAGLIDIRRDRYFGKRVNMPWMTAANWSMPTDPGSCPSSVADDIYLHVFQDTQVTSEIAEPFTFRMSGMVDTIYSGIHPRTPHGEIVAKPRRNRAMLLTFDTDTPSKKVTQDGYKYRKPSYPTYHCEGADVTGRMAVLTQDRDAFIDHALKLINGANGGNLPL